MSTCALQVMPGDTVNAGPTHHSGNPRACLFALSKPGETKELSGLSVSGKRRAVTLDQPNVPHDVDQQHSEPKVYGLLIAIVWPRL